MTTFVFVLGTGRCGSTLVQELLLDHPDVGFVSIADENLRALGVKGRWNNGLHRLLRSPNREGGDRRSGFLHGAAARVRLRAAPTEGYALLSRAVSPLLAGSSADLTPADVTPALEERFRTFFEGRARAQGKPVFVHKFTGWPRAQLIHAIMPEARFVHVVRDGRAVAASLLRMPWWRGRLGPGAWGFGPLRPEYAGEWEASGGSLPVLAGLEWKVLMDAFQEARLAMPGAAWLEVRYEDVVRDPRGSMAEVLRFTGLEWTGAFEQRLASRDIRSGRPDRWRDELSPRDAGMLQACLADHLDRWGYAGTNVGRPQQAAGP